MFKKILIANRGEIAVRIARTCREMDIQTVAVYEPPDETSLHIRMADECVLLDSPRGFLDQTALLKIAHDKGVDAIHPGYGFLAENIEFAAACRDAGFAFIAPPLATLQHALDKIETLRTARAAGFRTIEQSAQCADASQLDVLRAEAERLGFPVILKSARGGRGRAQHLVRAPEFFHDTAQRALREAQTIYGLSSVYLEKVITPAHQVGVQMLADEFGNLIHLGEREGSLLHSGQKLLEESPAPCLNDAQGEELYATALALAKLFALRGMFSLEFLVDAAGNFHFSEIKPRIQIDHPLTELRTRLDLVREQICLAAGEPLDLTQAHVALQGWAVACRIQAQDPEQHFLPSPGRVRVRFPNGPETRTDTYVYSGCNVPAAYDPLIAKIIVWGSDRAVALARMERALNELSFHGIATNVAWMRKAVSHPAVRRGNYSTETEIGTSNGSEVAVRDLAIASALVYARANEMTRTRTPERMQGEWHRAARTLPE